ncbi:hypothetical protein Chor_003438 [Crotalus horridus]
MKAAFANQNINTVLKTAIWSTERAITQGSMWILILLAGLELCWAQYNPNTLPGRTSIVHLFEWRWNDIALECERYLAPNGFGGVQISPPNENLIITTPWRPWWERYQPISYKLCTRSGSESEFKDMVNRCNNVGVRDCRLVSLLDLALEKDYVRSKVAEYMNQLIDIGVAGFRIDASKHMWPGDMKAFLDKLKNLNAKWFAEGTRPFIFQEVNCLHIYFIPRINIKYITEIGKMAKNWGEGWSFMPSDKAVVFVDNHDNQRGHGAGGAAILTFWDSRLYKIGVGFMLAHPYGFTRVMSSFSWPRHFENGKDINDWVGPPSYEDGSVKPVTINPDTTCGNGWICEHRWRQIRNMVIFRNVVDGQPFTNWWDNNSNQVAFGRGNQGFIVFNNDDWNLIATLQTGLPEGIYCDIISGQKEGNNCTGIKIQVHGDGTANFNISHFAEDPFVAIHIKAKL